MLGMLKTVNCTRAPAEEWGPYVDFVYVYLLTILGRGVGGDLSDDLKYQEKKCVAFLLVKY